MPEGTGRVHAKIRLAFLGDSVVVNNLPKVPITFDRDSSMITITMNRGLSSFFWDTEIVTSWLTWWSSRVNLKFDPVLGVLVYQQSNDTNLVFSQDACKPRRTMTILKPVVSSYPNRPVGEFCSNLASGSSKILVTFSSTHMTFFGTPVPFDMDGPIIQFDQTHPGYLDFLLRLNLGRPSNNLFTFQAGSVKAEVGSSKFSLIPCEAEISGGKFCHRVGALTSLVLEGTDEMRLSVASPLGRRLFARPVIVSDGSDRSHVGLLLCKQIGWDCTTFRIGQYDRDSFFIDIGTRVLVFKRC